MESSCKFKVGDKVLVIKGQYKSLYGVVFDSTSFSVGYGVKIKITKITGDEVVRYWFFEDGLVKAGGLSESLYCD